MLRIVLGFFPWVLYSILMGMSIQRETIILITLASACLLGYKELKKRFVLPWSTVIFFLLLLALNFFFPYTLLLKHGNLLSNSALAALSWLSLVFRRPFTLQYAREQTAKEIWELPGFFRSNQIITAVWAGSFTVCAGASFLHIYANLSDALYQTASYIPLGFAVWFTMKFPDWYRQRKIDRLIQISEEAQKSNFFLKGHFAPVTKELDQTNLPIEGELPKDLFGVYMRNGPNPVFAPFSYTFPFDGDGMVHAVYIRDGHASFRNRFIETDQLQVERRLGKAVYGGVDCPFIREPGLLLPEDPTLPVKLGRFIHVIRHANKYIALHEANPAYEINAHLETVGPWNPTQSKIPISVNPHPRLDPATGELYLISYDLDRPIVTYHVLDAKGKLLREGTIDVPHCYMIHDFVLTKNYFILFLCPVVIDKLGGAKGKHMFNWESQLETQIALVSRANPSGPILWMQSEPFFTFHFANAYETEHEIKIDYVRYPKFTMKNNELDPGHLYRTTIDLRQRRCSHRQIDDRNVEYPRINESKNASLYRYAYIPSNLIDKNNVDVFNAIMKYDLKSDQALTHEFGAEYEVGEAVFVPKPHATEEDDGYLMLFACHRPTHRTDFFLLDARHISAKPIARVSLPQRVPHGLHGSWMAGPW